MKFVPLKEPITIRPGDVTEPTVYQTMEDFGDRFAVTVEGAWRRNKKSEDRFDSRFPCPGIAVDCGYLSKGICANRVDNTTFDQINVTESRGQSLKVLAVRQSEFRTVRVHRGQSPDSIICVTGVDDSFSPNMLLFGQVSCMANDAPRTVEFVNASGAKNPVRVVTVSQLLCHIAWPSMAEQFPMTKSFGPRVRTHLDLGDATGVTITSVNMRLHKDDLPGSLAIRAGESARECVVDGGQILRRRGEDWQKLVAGNVVVFPHFR
jgi:hypothetical protein